MTSQAGLDLVILDQFKDLPGFDPELRAYAAGLRPTSGLSPKLNDLMQTNSLKTLAKGIDRKRFDGTWTISIISLEIHFDVEYLFMFCDVF